MQHVFFLNLLFINSSIDIFYCLEFNSHHIKKILYVNTNSKENQSFSFVSGTDIKNSWLYVLVISHTRFRVNPHSIVAWISRNWNLEFKRLQLDSNPQPPSLWTKWLLVRVQLQSLKKPCFLCRVEIP